MKQKEYTVLGMMSGTSLDGLDMAYCRFWQNKGFWKYAIEYATTIPYSEDKKSALQEAINLEPMDLFKLHHRYGEWLGKTAKKFLGEHKLTVDFISSHGHTIHHRPEESYTFQAGDGAELAKHSGQTVICDFRTEDVKQGGQGAPLVPIGDRLLLGEYDYCLNLGGISNISFEQDGNRIAYDIGIANMLLNPLAQRAGLPYDRDGALARQGSLNKALYEALNGLEYYTLPYPKSTGYEWFAKEVWPLVETFDDTPENLLHTAVHHIAEQIAMAVQSTLEQNSQPSSAKAPAGKPSPVNSQLLATGGGAKNSFLMEILQEKLGDQIQLIIPDKKLIDYKEALVFALMGILKMEGQINILSSVTGGEEDLCSGVVFNVQ
ncbi:MAG: anhydro-N-acetylmuramic acid kinase [Flavobacteriaceae bacterium]|nr:anhydro-N-acetylmuramic acid kinase [Flavobacteriaceae bacterium]